MRNSLCFSTPTPNVSSSSFRSPPFTAQEAAEESVSRVYVRATTVCAERGREKKAERCDFGSAGTGVFRLRMLA